MIHPKIALPKIAHSGQSKSFRNRAAVILATLILTVAAATTQATAQAYTDLFNFDGIHGATKNPLEGSTTDFTGIIAQGRDGNLYGTTAKGGSSDIAGVLFKITPEGSLTVLHYFQGTGDDSWWPVGGLTLGTDGNFYGTTRYGDGDSGSEAGEVFKITPSGSFTMIHHFDGVNGHGVASPTAPPIQGTDGNFYGTSTSEGTYKITPSGSYTNLGTMPEGERYAPLLQATDGNFYGTTRGLGDKTSYGTVFKMTPAGIVNVVHKFRVAQGEEIDAPVIQGSDGNFYGTNSSYPGGTVFKLTPQGAITILHTFYDPNYPWAGAAPYGLLQASDGNLYGTALAGGTSTSRGGFIFQITPAGGYSEFYNFWPGQPRFIPMQHTNGKIYGLTFGGGTYDRGVVYSLDLGLPPFVSLVSTSGKVGTSITILGQGFTGTTNVSFNGAPATFKVGSDTFLKATVPSGATTGSVTVTTASGTLTSNHPFRVHPVILSVTPGAGAAGTPVVITGTSFTQTTKVTFGGGVASATFTVDSDTQVTATVPAGAPTGYIVLTTVGGRSRGPDTFTVTP